MRAEIPLDRRESVRRAISVRATDLQAEDQCSAHPKKICSLQLIDISDTGLGSLAQEGIELGTAITVFFPPHGPERGFDRYGHIVRCAERGGRQEIGIEFDRRTAT